MDDTRRSMNITIIATEMALLAVLLGISAAALICYGNLIAVVAVSVLYGGPMALGLMHLLWLRRWDRLLDVPARLHVWRSWLLVLMLPWYAFVQWSFHTNPDGLNAIAFVYAGVVASFVWILLAFLPDALLLLIQSLKAPGK